MLSCRDVAEVRNKNIPPAGAVRETGLDTFQATNALDCVSASRCCLLVTPFHCHGVPGAARSVRAAEPAASVDDGRHDASTVSADSSINGELVAKPAEPG